MGRWSRRISVAFLVLSAIFFARGALADRPRHLALADMTWPEVATAIREGSTTIIIPIGGTEQSGPFIAVGKHNVRAFSLAERIAGTLGHTLVAPVISYVPEGKTSPRTSHMRFAGTISIPPRIFKGLLVGAAESFRAQGFKRIAFIYDHGGYRHIVAAVVQNLNAHWDASVRAIDVTDYYAAIGQDFEPWLRQRGFGAAIGEHADIMDTALMLAVNPKMVRTQLMMHSAKPSAQDGAYGGDPRLATAALGEVGINMQVHAAVAQLSNVMR